MIGWYLHMCRRWIPGTQEWRIRKAMADLAAQLEWLASRQEPAE